MRRDPLELMLHLEIWPEIKKRQSCIVLMPNLITCRHYWRTMDNMYRFDNYEVSTFTLFKGITSLRFLSAEGRSDSLRGLRSTPKVFIHQQAIDHKPPHEKHDWLEIAQHINGRAKPHG